MGSHFLGLPNIVLRIDPMIFGFIPCPYGEKAYRMRSIATSDGPNAPFKKINGWRSLLQDSF